MVSKIAINAMGDKRKCIGGDYYLCCAASGSEKNAINADFSPCSVRANEFPG